MGLNELIKDWLRAQDDVQLLEQNLKGAKSHAGHLENQIIDLMDIDNMTSCKIEGIGTFILGETLYCTIDRQHFDKAKEFFEERGLWGQMTKEDIKKSRLNEFVKGLMESGQTVPEWIERYVKKYLSIRKGV